jgi:hypothetical protein
LGATIPDSAFWRANANEMIVRFLIYVHDHFIKEQIPPDIARIFRNEYGEISSEINFAQWPFRCWEDEVKELIKLLWQHIYYYWEFRSLGSGNVGSDHFHELRFVYAGIISVDQIRSYFYAMNYGPPALEYHPQPYSELCIAFRPLEKRFGRYAMVSQNISNFMSNLLHFEGLGYHSPFRRSFQSVSKDITEMNDQIQRYTANSKIYDEDTKNEMRYYIMFWFFDSNLATECGNTAYNPSQFQKKILEPFRLLAFARLKDVMAIPSLTADKERLKKISLFIDDYLERTFTNPKHDVIFAIEPFLKMLMEMKKMLFVRNSDVHLDEFRAFARLSSYWFLHPDFKLGTDENYNAFLGGLSYAMKNMKTLFKMANIFKKTRSVDSCKPGDIGQTKRRFCKLNELILDLVNYVTTINSTPITKIFNPSSEYKTILDHAATSKTVLTNIEALDVGQMDLQSSLSSLRISLGSHFHHLATFDEGKAGHDVVYLQSKMTDFNTRLSKSDLDDKLTTIFYYALGANVAELAALATQLAAAIASNANPMKWITGEADPTDIMDRLDAVAQAAVDSVKLATIKDKILPDIITQARRLSAANAKNAETHKTLADLFKTLKESKEININEVKSSFLNKYGNYDPGYYKNDITKYITLVNEAIEKLCEVLYGGKTVLSAVVESVGASKAVCIKATVEADVVGAIYEEMYDFQYEFMDAMAAAVRALIAKHSSKAVRSVPAGNDRILLKIYVHRIKLLSKQHVLVALQDYCNVQEYENGGVPTHYCEQALNNPSFGNIILVLGNPISACLTDEMTTIDALIPAKSNPLREKLDPGVMDLTQLYAGEYTELSIPFSKSSSGNPAWVHKFISPTLPVHEDVALYVKRFELFLPSMTNSGTYEVEITAKGYQPVTVTHSNHTMKYAFLEQTEFHLSYGENEESCSNKFERVYPMLCKPHPPKICLSSHGVVSQNELPPPLFNTWYFRAFLPKLLPQPKPDKNSAFHLRATIKICTKNPKKIDLDSTKYQQHVVVKERKRRCCGKKKYWYRNPLGTDDQSCQPCESPKLGGLYCEKLKKG